MTKLCPDCSHTCFGLAPVCMKCKYDFLKQKKPKILSAIKTTDLQQHEEVKVNEESKTDEEFSVNDIIVSVVQEFALTPTQISTFTRWCRNHVRYLRYADSAWTKRHDNANWNTCIVRHWVRLYLNNEKFQHQLAMVA